MRAAELAQLEAHRREIARSPPLARDWRRSACVSPTLLPWMRCIGKPSARAGLMVCAPIRRVSGRPMAASVSLATE